MSPEPCPVLAHRDLRDDVDLRLLDRLGEPVHDLLHELELRAAVGADLLLDRDRLRDADAGGPLGLGLGERADLLGFALAEHARLLGLGLGQRLNLRGLLLSARVVGLALVRLDRDRDLGLGEQRLLLGARLGLAQLALLRGGPLLARVGLDLLLGDLARAELDRGSARSALRRPRAGRRRADQHLEQLEVVVRELLLHLARPRLLLDRAAVLDELDERARLADVLEVRRDHRVERLLDEPLDVAEALDDERRLAVVDVHDDRERERRLEGVLGDQRDLGEVLVEAVRAGLVADPLQDEVGRRHEEHLAGVRVERVLAGKERVVPDAALVVLDQLAVLVLVRRRGRRRPRRCTRRRRRRCRPRRRSSGSSRSSRTGG